MAAYWQGYGTLGVGEQVGSVTWGNAHALSAMALHDEHSQMNEVSVAGDLGGGASKGGQFMSSFAGQGQLPFQVRRRAREQQAEALRQAHLQERVDLLQALKKAVQRLLMLAVQREASAEQGASTPAAASTTAQHCDAEEQSALHQVVDAVYSIFSHGIKPPGRQAMDVAPRALVGGSCSVDTAEAVWKVLQLVAHAVPSRCLTLALVQQQLRVVTAEGCARAFVRLCICDKSIEDVLAGTADLPELEEMYEDWAFVRDIEHNNTLPTFLGGVAHVQVYFDWLHSDDEACGALADPAPSTTPALPRPSAHKCLAGMKGSAPCKGEGITTGVGGAGGGASLSAIPEHAEHLEEDEDWVEIPMGRCARGDRDKGKGRGRESDGPLLACVQSTSARRPKGKAKKVREITISEAVSGNSGLDGEGDQGMCQADSSTMDLNKLIESVAKGMEGSEVRKGARVKGGKKKKKSDNQDQCPAASADGVEAASRHSRTVSLGGRGDGSGGGGSRCQENSGHDTHFPVASSAVGAAAGAESAHVAAAVPMTASDQAPAEAGAGREQGRSSEGERAGADLPLIAASAESPLLLGVAPDQCSHGQMVGHRGGGQGCEASSTLFSVSSQVVQSPPPRDSKTLLEATEINGGVPIEGPASPGRASLHAPPPTSCTVSNLPSFEKRPNLEADFSPERFGSPTPGLYTGEEGGVAVAGRGNHCENGGDHVGAAFQGTGDCSAQTNTAMVRSPLGRGRARGARGGGRGAIGRGVVGCGHSSQGDVSEEGMTGVSVRGGRGGRRGRGMSVGIRGDGGSRVEGHSNDGRGDCWGGPNGMHDARGCADWRGDDAKEVRPIVDVEAGRVREVQAGGTSDAWRDFLRNHCNGLLADVSLSPVERFLAATVDVGEDALVTFDQVRPALLRSGFSEEQCFDLMRDVLEGNFEGANNVRALSAHGEREGVLAGRETAADHVASGRPSECDGKPAAAAYDSLHGVSLSGAEGKCGSGEVEGESGAIAPPLKPGPPKPKRPPPPLPRDRGLEEGGSGMKVPATVSWNTGDNEEVETLRGGSGFGADASKDDFSGSVDGMGEREQETAWDKERELLEKEILEKEREEMERDKAMMEVERKMVLEELERERERKRTPKSENAAAVRAYIGELHGEADGAGKGVSGGWRWGKAVKGEAGLKNRGWLSRLTGAGGGAQTCGAVGEVANNTAHASLRDGDEGEWWGERLQLSYEGGVGGGAEREYTGAPVGLITSVEGVISGQWGEGMGAIVGRTRECPGCGAIVASGILGAGRWCEYTRAYYCGMCHNGDTHVIIARVLKDWDFNPRPVSIPAALFLRDNVAQPLLSLSSDLSLGARAKAGKALHLVTCARRRAALLRDYVVQCPNFPNSRCQEEDRIAAVTLATRSHLLADDDTVSLKDLMEIQNGALLKFLDATAQPWAHHVLHKCRLCHDKGHCCEICLSEEMLFLWDEDKISTCERCGAISHQRCAAAAAASRAGLSCRKCERIRRVREDRQRRLSDTSSGGYSSGFSSGGGGGGLWGEAAAAGLGGVYSEEVEWEQDEGDVERELDMLLPLAR